MATSLHSDGDLFSQGYAVGANVQGGVRRPAGMSGQGTLWYGSAASAARVHPDDNVVSEVFGISGTNAVGYNRSGPFQRLQATMWNTATLSATNLHPNGVSGSIAYGAGGNQQVGAIFLDGSGDPASMNAVLWNGSSSYINLDQGSGSAAVATDGTRQVGWINTGQGRLASMWSGSSGSWVDISNGIPSAALAISGTQIGGYVFNSNFGEQAVIWDVNDPSNPEALELGNRSEVRGVSGGYQAGYVEVGGGVRATVWHGAGSARINLHSFLPEYYEASEANAIFVSGESIYVVGTAYNSATQRAEAMYWTYNPVPEPASMLGLGVAMTALLTRRRRKN